MGNFWDWFGWLQRVRKFVSWMGVGRFVVVSFKSTKGLFFIVVNVSLYNIMFYETYEICFMLMQLYVFKNNYITFNIFLILVFASFYVFVMLRSYFYILSINRHIV